MTHVIPKVHSSAECCGKGWSIPYLNLNAKTLCDFVIAAAALLDSNPTPCSPCSKRHPWEDCPCVEKHWNGVSCIGPKECQFGEI